MAKPKETAGKTNPTNPLLGDQALSEIMSEEVYIRDGSWIEDNDCFYFLFNPKLKSYFCPFERFILRRNLYSKRELEMFLERLRQSDRAKLPEVFPITAIALGFTFLVLAVIFLVVAWRAGFKDNIPRNNITFWSYFFWIAMGIAIVLALVLIGLGVFLFIYKQGYDQAREKIVLPILDDENARVGNRGLNWQYSPNSLILYCNYYGYGSDRLGGAMGMEREVIKGKQTTTAMKRKPPTNLRATRDRSASKGRGRSPAAASGKRYSNNKSNRSRGGDRSGRSGRSGSVSKYKSSPMRSMSKASASPSPSPGASRSGGKSGGRSGRSGRYKNSARR